MYMMVGIYAADLCGDDDDGRRVLSADSPPDTVSSVLSIHIQEDHWNTVMVWSRGMIVKRARKPADPYVAYIYIHIANIHTSVPP